MKVGTELESDIITETYSSRLKTSDEETYSKWDNATATVTYGDPGDGKQWGVRKKITKTNDG